VVVQLHNRLILGIANMKLAPIDSATVVRAASELNLEASHWSY
jgi:hypothetical protein